MLCFTMRKLKWTAQCIYEHEIAVLRYKNLEAHIVY